MTHAAPDPDPQRPAYDPDGVYDVDADGGIDGSASPPDEGDTGGGRPEPVRNNSIVQLVVAALVTTGWFVADSPWIPIAGTAVGLAVSIATLLRTRAKVTPAVTAVLELATSSAPLAKPGNRENWVEKTAKDGGGGLPPGIRKVARALKKKHPEWTLSHCIAVAQSMSAKWAARGSAKGARNVAGMQALQARNKSRQSAEVAASHPADAAAVLELSHAVLVELARIVRTEAGARKYGVPIGGVIGTRGPHARVRGTAAREALSTKGRVAVAEKGLHESTAKVVASGKTGASRQKVRAARAQVAAHQAGNATLGRSQGLSTERLAAEGALTTGHRAHLGASLQRLGLKPAEADRVAGQMVRMDPAKARRRLDVLAARAQIASLDQRRRRGHLSLTDHAKARQQLQRQLGHAQDALRAA